MTCRFQSDTCTLSLKAAFPVRGLIAVLYLKALDMVLSSSQHAPMIHRLDLSENPGIGDAELERLARIFANQGVKQGCKIRHLSIRGIGASPAGLASLIKQLHRLPHLSSLDLSNNSFAFFCADTLVSYFKAADRMPAGSRNSQSIAALSPSCQSISGVSSHLLKLNLSGTKLDDLAAF